MKTVTLYYESTCLISRRRRYRIRAGFEDGIEEADWDIDIVDLDRETLYPAVGRLRHRRGIWSHWK